MKIMKKFFKGICSCLALIVLSTAISVNASAQQTSVSAEETTVAEYTATAQQMIPSADTGSQYNCGYYFSPSDVGTWGDKTINSTTFINLKGNAQSLYANEKRYYTTLAWTAPSDGQFSNHTKYNKVHLAVNKTNLTIKILKGYLPEEGQNIESLTLVYEKAFTDESELNKETAFENYLYYGKGKGLQMKEGESILIVLETSESTLAKQGSWTNYTIRFGFTSTDGVATDYHFANSWPKNTEDNTKYSVSGWAEANVGFSYWALSDLKLIAYQDVTYVDKDKTQIGDKISVRTGEEITLPSHQATKNIRTSVNHRGNAGGPENTLTAIRGAAAKGFTAVEMDVAFTSDNVPVLLHDDTLARTSNYDEVEEKDIAINEIDFESVRKYDFGAWAGETFAGEKIPSFEEAIALCKELNISPWIEIKLGNYTEDQIARLVEIVKNADLQNKCTWISFSATYLGYVKNKQEDATLACLCNTIDEELIKKTVALKNANNVVYVNCKYTGLTKDNIDSVVQNGLKVATWTLDNVETLLALDSRVEAVTSDYVNINILETGKIFVGWKNGDKLYPVGAKLTVSETIAFEAAYISFVQTDGAYFKIGTQNSGIAFESKLMTNGVTVKEYGTLIMPTDNIGELNFTLENFTAGTDVLKIRAEIINEDKKAGVVSWLGGITKLHSCNYNKYFSGRGYVEVEYADRTTAIFYTDYNENANSGKINELAYLYKKDANSDYTSLSDALKGVVDGYISDYVPSEIATGTGN